MLRREEIPKYSSEVFITLSFFSEKDFPLYKFTSNNFQIVLKCWHKNSNKKYIKATLKSKWELHNSQLEALASVPHYWS